MTKICVEIDPDDNGNQPAAPVRSYSATIGDGTNTTYNVAHNLGTRDALYSLRNISTGELDAFEVSVNVSDPDTAVLTFPVAPAAGSVRVNVLAAPAASNG